MKKFTIGMIFTLLIFFVGSAFAETNWHSHTMVDDMNDSTTTIAFTPTSDYDGLFTGAMLIAQCNTDGGLDVAIKYKGEVFFDNSVKAEIRFGKGPIESSDPWYVATDSSAIMSAVSRRSLIKRLINEDQFVIRIHPTYGPAITSKFNTTGSDELNTVLKACSMFK